MSPERVKRLCWRSVPGAVLLGAMLGNVPAQQSCTPPPIGDLLVRFDKAAAESERKLADYEWIVIRNASIATSQREGQPAEVYLSYAVNGIRVERMFLENGTTLTAAKQKQVDKAVAKALAHKQRLSSNPADMLGSDAVFLKAGTFTGGRCGTSGGRKTFIFQYRGQPGAKGFTPDQKMASHLSGTMVFDANEGSAGTADFRLDSDVSMAVVFRLKKGLLMHMATTRVAPGIWYTADMSFSGGVRLFFNGASMTMQQHALHFVPAARHTQDPYQGMSFGALPPEVRSAMVDGLDGILRYPVPDDTETE